MSIELVMPMAGRGSRFALEGVSLPKPLVELAGRPFFWWATQSILRASSISGLTYVVLEEHVRNFSIEKAIHRFFPQARCVVLEDITSGALETALHGTAAISSNLPIVVNDCDHAFVCPELSVALNELGRKDFAALLCHFWSDKACYSYAKYDDFDLLEKTVEKEVVSNNAIAGAYGFSDRGLFAEVACEYKKTCPYDELYISGVFNVLARFGLGVKGVRLAEHYSFGTPSELQDVLNKIDNIISWKKL